MTDQIKTSPESNAEMSANNNNKAQAPKDKSCPFCQQQFTSSSLGRHLDLYIKDKNPKPADGLHDVDEIRKLRGGITRRQPRNSINKRENSIISMRTPGASDRRSPRTDSERDKNQSPSLRSYEGINGQTPLGHLGNSNKLGSLINRGTWDTTGTMNNIPTQWTSDTRSWDGEEKEYGRRADARSRSVSRKILAKTSFEQKQKVIDALDNAKAAELALRELVGSLRAAKQQVQTSSILDYDPLTMDFPALCLHCLPPPPTLHTNTPIASSSSWSLSPPEDPQYQALHNHFSTTFHNYRMSLSITTSSSKHDGSYPPHSQYSISANSKSATSNAESAANQMEGKINTHLQAIYRAWQALTPTSRNEIWTISLARSIAIKSSQIDKLKQEVEGISQEATHLRQQLDELSRLQYPREFKIAPPRTVRIESEIISALGEKFLNVDGEGVSYGENRDPNNGSKNCTVNSNLLDRNVHMETAVERAISRWKNVVKEVRSHNGGSNGYIGADRGLNAQQSLSGNSAGTRERIQAPSIQVSNEWERSGDPGKNESINTGVGSDADADADMEEEDASSFVEMVDAPPILQTQSQSQHLVHQNHQHKPQHQSSARDQGFRINTGSGSTSGHGVPANSCGNGGHTNQTSNGNQGSANSVNVSTNSKINSSNGRGMEGIENQVGGYVRIGA